MKGGLQHKSKDTYVINILVKVKLSNVFGYIFNRSVLRIKILIVKF